MTPTYETCRHCGAWQNTGLLGETCTACCRPMVDTENRTSAPKNDTPAASPIVGRKIFRSASLRRAETPANTV
jgi:hypothetical protein